MDLFEVANHKSGSASAPLAERLRPQNLESFVGQEKVLGPGRPFRRHLEKGQLTNLILWGPPGTGKTTFAYLVALKVEGHFLSINAVDTGAKKLREIGQQGHDRRIQFGQRSIVFIDEIHRLNKGQQDVLLPFAERGDFTIIGATTENPSYELNSALLSRCQVLVFEKHSQEDLLQVLEQALGQLELSSEELFTKEARLKLCLMADGDARQLLNLLEQVLMAREGDLQEESAQLHWPLTLESLEQLVSATPLYYDKGGDEHYDTISAFIKSVRGSDPDAAIYYLARMLEGGEDPVFVARRLVILASEDVGNADPRALTMAVSGLQAVELIGLPEAALSLAQVTTYLSSAPKSNRSYLAIKKAQALVKQTGRLPIPKALRSSQTKLTRSLGYGEGYKYSHDGPKGWAKQEFLPSELKGTELYVPADRGFEKNIREYLKWMKDSPAE